MTLEEATAKSTQLNVMFMETSAKAGHNVKSLFKKIAMSLPGMEKEGQADGQNTSMSLFYIYITSSTLRIYATTVEIDVTTPATTEVPEASNCNC